MLEGQIHPDFGAVAATLLDLLPRDIPGGAAVCVYHCGECVVDVWGGTRDQRGNPWEESTLALCFSTTKGVLATLVHVLVDRGVLRYDDAVAKYWPEFEGSGKQDVTLRHLLCHEAGLYNVRDLIDHAKRMLDWDFMTRSLARAKPSHAAGASHGYHGLTYGWLLGELLQRATGQSLGALLERELAIPLGLDGLFVGLPEQELPRMAELQNLAPSTPSAERARGDDAARPSWPTRLNRSLQAIGFPIDFGCFAQALLPVGIAGLDWNSPALLSAAIPAANGVFTARSLARVYAALAQGGSLNGVRLLGAETLDEATRIQNRGLDRVLPIPLRWRLGYHRVICFNPRMPKAFGHFGLGGSGALAEPTRRLAVAFTSNWGLGTPLGDLRVTRLARAAARCCDRR